MDKFSEIIVSEQVENIDTKFSINTYSASIVSGSNEIPVNIRFVLFDDPNLYTISKSIIEKEYLVNKTLPNKSCSLKIEHPSMTYQLYNEYALLGYCTERLWITMADEIKLRQQKTNKLEYEKDEIKNILFSLVDILAEAQNKGIYHGPLLPNNLIRTHDFELKLVGWGQEFYIDLNLKNLRELETYLPEYTKFICPSTPLSNKYHLEYFDHKIYCKDVYSLAKIIYKLITEQTLNIPYNDSNANDQIIKIKEELKKKGYDDNFISIIAEMFRFNPENRRDFVEIRANLLNLGYDKISLSKEMREKRINFIKQYYSKLRCY